MDDGAAVADSAEPNGNDASMPAEELHEESSSSARGKRRTPSEMAEAKRNELERLKGKDVSKIKPDNRPKHEARIAAHDEIVLCTPQCNWGAF